MIKTEKGNLEITGYGSEILADLETITRGIKLSLTKNGEQLDEISKELILTAVKAGFYEEKDSEEMLIEMLKEAILKN